MCQIWLKMAQNTGFWLFPVEISEIQEIYPIGILFFRECGYFGIFRILRRPLDVPVAFGY